MEFNVSGSKLRAVAKRDMRNKSHGDRLSVEGTKPQIINN